MTAVQKVEKRRGRTPTVFSASQKAEMLNHIKENNRVPDGSQWPSRYLFVKYMVRDLGLVELKWDDKAVTKNTRGAPPKLAKITKKGRDFLRRHNKKAKNDVPEVTPE